MTLMRPTVFLIQYLREPLFKTAIFIGQALDSVNDRLANALQIYENFERDKRRYSVPLIEASLQKAASEVESADFWPTAGLHGCESRNRARRGY